MPDPREPEAFPTAAMFVNRANFLRPAPLHFGPAPAVGEEVHVAGYFPERLDGPTPSFWTGREEIAKGRVIEPPKTAGDERAGLIWIAVPRGDYGGFLGGPAGNDIDAGPRRVFGIVLFQQSGQEGPADGDTAVLAIHPLPIEIQAGTE